MRFDKPSPHLTVQSDYERRKYDFRHRKNTGQRPLPRNCLKCEREFIPKKFWQDFCCAKCRTSFHNDKAISRVIPEPTEPTYEEVKNNFPHNRNATCSYCGKSFEAKNHNQRYCCTAHRIAFYEAVDRGEIQEGYECPKEEVK